MAFDDYIKFPHKVDYYILNLAESPYNFSPVAVFITRLNRLFGFYLGGSAINGLSLFTVGLILFMLCFVLYKYGNKNQFAAVTPWLSATLIPFQVVAHHYLVWILPILFYLFTEETRLAERRGAEGVFRVSFLFAAFQSASNLLLSFGLLLLFFQSLTNLFSIEREGAGRSWLPDMHS